MSLNLPERKSPQRADAVAAMWARHGHMATPRSVGEVIAMGAQMLMIKDASPHGTWLDRLNAMGVDAKTASACMAAARRFGEMPEAFLASVGSVSKLRELLVLADEQLETLAQGDALQIGGVDSMKLEDLAAMTVQELRAAVRGIHGRAYTPPKPARLTPLEETMLRNYRKCSKPAQALLLQTAQMLAGQAQTG